MTKKKYSIIAWDWRSDAPISEIVSESKFYNCHFHNFVDDTNYVIFSDTRIKSDEEAEMILSMDAEELDNL